MSRFAFVLPLLLPILLGLAAGCSGFRSVGEGVYRAPQMHEDLLARTVMENEIRTIVCLRGSGRSSRSSSRAAIGTDAAFWNVPMSATSLPRPEALAALWQIAEQAERPLLLHCRAGVDRTGLASAILVLHDTGDLELARDQLDLIPYGHVSWSATGAMDEVLELYAPHAAEGMAFPDWVADVYPAIFHGT